MIPQGEAHSLWLEVREPQTHETGTVRIHLCSICYQREQQQARKYIMQKTKWLPEKRRFSRVVKTTLGSPLGGVPPYLKQTLRELRAVLEATKTPLSTQKLSDRVPEIREQVVEKLLYAIKDAFDHAKALKPATPKDKNVVWNQQNYYRLIGYLTQVLNGVLEDVDLAELSQRMSKVEAQVAILKGGPGQAPAQS